MLRLLCPAVLALSIPTLGLAESDADKTARCQAQAGIVQQAVDLRLEKKRARRAEKQILKPANELDEKYAPSVPHLVAWVYSLPEGQLTPDVGPEFETACSAY